MNLANETDHDCIISDRDFPTVKLRFSPSVTILVYIVYLLPFCFGVFGNISVCLIFFQQKKLRSITNTFLMNLCLNDLIVLCVSIPMTLSAALLEHWVFGAFLCKFVNFTPTLTALVSTFTVAVIAVERWLFIVNKKKFDRHCTIVTLALLWIVSVLIALPEFISRHILELPLPPPMPKDFSSSNLILNHHIDYSKMPMMKSSCHEKKLYFCVIHPGIQMRIFSYIVNTVQYLVPFFFVSVSCYSISRFLKRRMKQMRTYQIHRSTNTSQSKKERQKKQRAQREQLDEVTENDFPSYDDLPVSIGSSETPSNNFLIRIRGAFKNREPCQNTMVIDQQSFRSNSIVGTVLMPSPSTKSQSHSERRFHRSKKLLICVAALFTISWLPLTVVQIYLEHNEAITRDEPHFVYGFLLIPCYLISSLSAWMNPVIYNYINRNFRREFYALYPCCKLSSSRLSSAPSYVPSRTEMPSIRIRRSQKQERKEPEDDHEALAARASNKSEARFVTFIEKEDQGKTALVLINEHT